MRRPSTFQPNEARMLLKSQCSRFSFHQYSRLSYESEGAASAACGRQPPWPWPPVPPWPNSTTTTTTNNNNNTGNTTTNND